MGSGRSEILARYCSSVTGGAEGEPHGAKAARSAWRTYLFSARTRASDLTPEACRPWAAVCSTSSGRSIPNGLGWSSSLYVAMARLGGDTKSGRA
jgi:hypothetical protein